ncbi:hypothetical protein VKS41_005555 [Umbelopsis sp. WA50703]
MKLTSLSAVVAAAFLTLPTSAIIDTFLWPIPQSLSWGDGKLAIDNSFKFDAPAVPELQAATARYRKLIWKERWTSVQVPFGNVTKHTNPTGNLKSIKISVKDTKADLEPGVDESYSIDIPENASVGTIHAETVWGALRALETFSQLVKAKSDSDRSSLYVAKTPVKIEDAPTFPYRGVMLDTARNYYTVEDILRTIDGMSYNKLNVFHWHITDSQSFPLQLETVPELGSKGAYTLHGKLLGYSKKDVKRIISYARERGVRIIPELDMPAHTASWGKGIPAITTCTERFYLDPTNNWDDRYASEPTAGQLNPVNPKTYQVVQQVIDEVTSWFTDDYYHAGGDEPVNKCWEDNKEVRDYMKKNNATGNDLLQTFLTKELAMVKKNKKTAILWEDAVTQLGLNIPKETILQVWTGTLKAAVQSGHKVIASSYNFYYLDCRSGNWNGNDTTVDEQVPPTIPQPLLDYINNNYPDFASDLIPSPNFGGVAGDWCAPFKSWQRVYSYDMTYNLTKTEAKSVLGGEVALWSEQSDSAVVDMKIWPRAAAAAEAMWSGRYDSTGLQRDIGEAQPRIFDWRYRLIERGIGAEPIQPLWCGKNPHECDLNYPWVFTHPKDGGGY